MHDPSRKKHVMIGSMSQIHSGEQAMKAVAGHAVQVDDTLFATLYQRHYKEWWHQQNDGIPVSMEEDNGFFYTHIDNVSANKNSLLVGFKPDGTMISQTILADFSKPVEFPSFIVQNGVVYICGVSELNAYSVVDGSQLWPGVGTLDLTNCGNITVVS